MKQKEIAKELGFSSSTSQRYRQDMKMRSPYKSNGPKRSKKTSYDLKRPQMTSKYSNEIVETASEEVRTKNNLGGGDPSDNPSSGRDLIDQAFSSPING